MRNPANFPHALLALLGLLLAVPPVRSQPASTDVHPAQSASASPLNAADVNAWLDGLLPFALKSEDIAGAVVVVVKDGQVLTEKGYGYKNMAARIRMDPKTTVIRPGSISKLFTWTAVMQLVEQGKLDLDQDVNRYLDFQIPPKYGQPITLRNLMTHTPGFEEALKDIDLGTHAIPLGDYIKTHLPLRIYPPGTTPAYSNYGAALAGYIVQRVSGHSFDDYIEQHLLGPLNMRDSSFRQPVPARMKSMQSLGYRLASLPPEHSEFIGPAPAGSLSSTADDMAKFMIAHLQQGSYQGSVILSPNMAVEMHAVQRKIYPDLNGTTLGFYETSRNGHRVIAHNGGTMFFHSDLHLFLDDNCGIFISLNSAGRDDAASEIHNALFHGFADRYFPTTTRQDGGEVDAQTRIAHAQLMAGPWESSRRSASNFFSLAGLLQPVNIAANSDGTLSVPFPGRGTLRWREVQPFVWQELDGVERIQAVVVDGAPVMLGFGAAPPAAFLRIPLSRSPSWLTAALCGALIVLLATGLYAPSAALIRKANHIPSPWRSNAAWLYYARSALSFAVVVVFGAFLATLVYLAADTARMSSATDPWIITMEAAAMLLIPTAVLIAALNIWIGWSEKHGWVKNVWAAVVLVSCGIACWAAAVFHLMKIDTHY